MTTNQETEAVQTEAGEGQGASVVREYYNVDCVFVLRFSFAAVAESSSHTSGYVD